MSDEIDQAKILEELHIKESLAKFEQKNKPLPPKGECYFCEKEFEEESTLKFCDAFCRDKYEKLEKIKKIKGQ